MADLLRYIKCSIKETFRSFVTTRPGSHTDLENGDISCVNCVVGFIALTVSKFVSSTLVINQVVCARHGTRSFRSVKCTSSDRAHRYSATLKKKGCKPLGQWPLSLTNHIRTQGHRPRFVNAAVRKPRGAGSILRHTARPPSG